MAHCPEARRRKGASIRGAFRAALATLLAAAALTSGLLASPVATAAGSFGATSAPIFVSGRVLVKFHAGASAETRSHVANSVGGTDSSEISDLGINVLKVPVGHEAAVVAALSRSQDVEYAERDAVAQKFDTTPNDYWWPNEWSQVKVNAPKAWDLTRGSSSVVIAVLDTGVDATQPDLQGALVSGWNPIAGTADTADTDGHGTDVAGIAGARSNNAIGVTSYCWSCSVMPVKVLGAGSSLASVVYGITWATDHGARVINMSWGYQGTDYSSLRSAIQYAHSHGAVLVAAAGNYGTSTPVYPAAYPEVLGVAGTDSLDNLYSWSDYGSWVKLAAPGCDYATGLGSWYGQVCGTSAAAPALAGVAALLASYAPLASNTQIEQALESSAVPIGSSVAYGRVDAYRALLAVTGAGGGSTGSAPSSTAPPAITGMAQVGQTLSASTGTWSGTTPSRYSYQWRRCDSAGTSCAAVSGATAANYVVGAGDVGCRMQVVVTASNTYGSGSAGSATTAVVQAAAASPTAPTLTTSFSGALNKKQPSQTFPLTVGTGVAKASLNFSRSSSLSLTVQAADGTIAGTASGASVLTLIANLPAGSYRYLVGGGNGNASFTLTISYPSP